MLKTVSVLTIKLNKTLLISEKAALASKAHHTQKLRQQYLINPVLLKN